jgi:hypothetical protein
MTTTKTTNNQTKKPRLKRYFRLQLELAPYPAATERKRFAFWDAELGQNRIMTVVQRVRDPKHMGDEKRNPVLYRNILDATHFVDSMDVDKWILISGGNALYHVVEPELRKLTRPMTGLCPDHKNNSDNWHTFEVGHGTDTLQLWRDQILYTLEHKYNVYDQSEVVAKLKALYKELYGDVLTEEINY